MNCGDESIAPILCVQIGNSSAREAALTEADPERFPQGLFVALPDQLHCTLYNGTAMELVYGFGWNIRYVVKAFVLKSQCAVLRAAPGESAHKSGEYEASLAGPGEG